MKDKTTIADVQFFELFISLKGRLSRRVFWLSFFVLFFVYLNGYLLLSLCSSNITTQAMYLFIPFAWGYFSIYVKRLHDLNCSGYRILWLLAPVLGPLYINFQTFFKRGNAAENKYGLRHHGIKFDYFKNPEFNTKNKKIVINDVTQMNPIVVDEVLVPKTVEELIQFIKNSTKAVCIGGGRFSMGGQTASPNSVHIDMRQLNQILEYSLEKKSIRVQAGIRWCDIHKFIDQFGLAIKTMQTYANFTVGGSLSVNAHGRYMGLGPLVLSVIEIQLILADGCVVTASPIKNKDLFFAAIGGYGGIGIITEAELALTSNVNVQRRFKKMPVEKYFDYFKQKIRGNENVVFHNADIYPSKYISVNAVSWKKTTLSSTKKSSVQAVKRIYPIATYFLWAISKTPFGKWRREFILDKILFFKNIVHTRNYEAGYNAAELAPFTGKTFAWVLQEYFVPIAQFNRFQSCMVEILQRYHVNALNISIRHAKQDPGTLLAWAKEEVFAFVLYYKQGITELDKAKVAIWTRELISAVIKCEGRYYLPYQLHATYEQFYEAYPGAKAFFELKSKVDPHYRFQNALWNKYYLNKSEEKEAMSSEFNQSLVDIRYYDKLYLFLQNIFHLFPEDKLFALIKGAAAKYDSNEEIYQHVQKSLKRIKPLLADLTYALPALFKQKQVIVKQTLQLLNDKISINGYLEIGSTGRYISRLRKKMKITGPIYLINDASPSNSISDILEREQFKKIGKHIPLDLYAPIPKEIIAEDSIDLVTCYIGLHHAPLDRLIGFVDSIVRILRPGGRLILREHDCLTEEMKRFCSLIHSVFNLGTQISSEDNAKELRYFRSAKEWCELLAKHNLSTDGVKLLQDNDPSDNTLMIFKKV